MEYADILPSTVDMNYWLTVFNPKSKWFGSDEASGKWMVTFETIEEMDEKYKILREALFANKLGPAFKTSTALDPGKHQPFRYFACVYVEDFLKENKTKKVLKALRKLGFDKRLVFKRDLETFMGIYGDNSFYMVSEEGDKVETFEPFAKQ